MSKEEMVQTLSMGEVVSPSKSRQDFPMDRRTEGRRHPGQLLDFCPEQ